MEMKRIYGGRAPDERSVQQLALERRLRDVRCNSAEESADFMVTLNTILGEFEGLGNTKADETMRASFSTRDQGGAPTSIRTASNPARYDERRVKTGVVASPTYLTSDMERRDEAVSSQSRTEGTKPGTGLDINQCAHYLKRNNRWRECRSHLNGKPPVE